jgi:hypothetical protein
VKALVYLQAFALVFGWKRNFHDFLERKLIPIHMNYVPHNANEMFESAQVMGQTRNTMEP